MNELIEALSESNIALSAVQGNVLSDRVKNNLQNIINKNKSLIKKHSKNL